MKKRMVFDYVKAAANLYGVANKNLIVQIYNHQNTDDIIDLEGLNELLASKSLKNSFFTDEGECLVHNVLTKKNLVDYVRNSQKDKPYYVPEKETLLLYKDDKYIDRNPAFAQFKDYLVSRLGLNDEQAEDYCVKAHFNVKYRVRMAEIMHDISTYGVNLTSEMTDELMKYLAVFMNHVRRWENGGLMPVELANTGYHAWKSQTSVPRVEKEATVLSDDKGRNDLCFCGSGKKYKKCHGLS